MLIVSKANLMEIMYLSFAVATISFTVTETKFFKPVREKVKEKNSFMGELIACGYCLSHWVAFMLVAIYQPRIFNAWWLIDYFLTALTIVWLSAFQWIIMRWLTTITNA